MCQDIVRKQPSRMYYEGSLHKRGDLLQQTFTEATAPHGDNDCYTFDLRMSHNYSRSQY